MPFIDNNASSLLFKNKHNHVVKSALICSAALAGIMAANPLAKPIVKADTVTTTQVEAPTNNWVATKPADIHVDNNQKTYTLNHGDTLWAIAQATKTDVNQLAQLNNIDLETGDQYHLATGLTIKLPADAQIEQNSAASNNGDNSKSTTANNSGNTETPAMTNGDSAAQTTNHAKTSPQSNSATTATGSQVANGSSKAGNTNKANNGANADTTKNGQVDPGKSQVSKPADVTHNEQGTKTPGNTSSKPGVSQSGALSNPGKSQAAKGSSKAGNASNTGSDTNTDTTKNGQVDPGKSQVSKPADVIHNEHGAKTSGKTISKPAISQSGVLSDGSTNSQTPSSSAGKTRSNTQTAGNSKHNTSSSSADNTQNNNNSNTASSSANKHSSAPASSGSKTSSNSTSNAGSGPVDINRGVNSSTSNAGSGPVNINRGANSSSSSANSSSNHGGSSSSSKNNDSSSSSSSNDNNSYDTGDTSNYNQTTPLNNNDLAKVVALEKQINDLQTQADTVDNNLQFYQNFIDATKHANGANPQDQLDKIEYQNTYYQKTAAESDMSKEQAQLTAIKAQLPIDAQTITNLQNRLAKPGITDAEKQTLKTDLNNAKATAVKDQETYQTLQAKISGASETVAQYKAYLARNADMIAALKGNNQTNSLVKQYQKYIDDNQKTEASLNAHITDIKHQLKAYGVTLNS